MHGEMQIGRSIAAICKRGAGCPGERRQVRLVIDAGTFQRVVGVNALGSPQMIHAGAPHLKAAQGSIVNVSSIAGALGIGSSVAYIASKGAVNVMTLYFARAMAPDVRVNAVCLGFIATRWFVDGLGQEGYEKIKAGDESLEWHPPRGGAGSAHSGEAGRRYERPETVAGADGDGTACLPCRRTY
jgi:NAD(P)-dependent dehydrogenase (short-subunit alcohol dehydrogenase family)